MLVAGDHNFCEGVAHTSGLPPLPALPAPLLLALVLLATPEALRILNVRGRSMEPELAEGDRLVVDTARTVPAPGELFVLWDGDGLVVKRVEPVRPGAAVDPTRARLRLVSANPDYPPYERPAADVHIVGRVLWKVPAPERARPAPGCPPEEARGRIAALSTPTGPMRGSETRRHPEPDPVLGRRVVVCALAPPRLQR